jgi:predicted  nucleic acid-binding Zn-ribbon protein
MGNFYSKSDNLSAKYEPFLTNVDTVDYSQIIRKLETSIENMRLDIRGLQEKNDRLEMRLSRMDNLIQNKYQELQNSVFNTNERIAIITKDMESLLNNDKLLLDKLIEKNIVSTILEEPNESSNVENSNSGYQDC